MPVVVGVNSMSVVHKGSGTIAIAFPDVCKVPAPLAGGVPIPYPNIAKTAAAKQKKTNIQGGKVASKGSEASVSRGDESGRVRGLVSSKVLVGGSKVARGGAAMTHNGEAKKTEARQLRGKLASLNAKLQNMTSKDPVQWQTVLQDYAVAASALYVTLNDDD